MNKLIYMDYLSELINSQLDNRIPTDIPENIEIEGLEKIAHENHMDYLILGALLKLPLEEDVIKRIRPYMLQSTMKTLQQVCETKKLQEAFEKAGIRNQVLKGAVMKQIYPRPEMREMSDIDFMIYEDSFDKAEQIMKDMGYEYDQAVKHHIIFKKKPYLIMEMHWSLYEQTVDKEQYLYYKEQFRANKKQGCRYTYEFSLEDFYVYMISHMAKHFYENGCGIRNLLDIYVYLQKYGNIMNRDKVQDELAKCGLVDFEYHVSKLADIWLNKKESTDFYNKLFLYMLDCGIYGKSENGIWGQLAKQTDSSNDKDFRRRYYFPSLQYMREYYPWLKKAGFLLPIAWLIRGVRGITNKESVDRMKMMQDEENVVSLRGIYQTLNLNFAK